MFHRLTSAILCILLFCFCLPGLSLSRVRAAETAPLKTTLPNGLRVIIKPETATPLVAVDVFVQAGASQETAANTGIGSFVAHSLLASTTSRPPDTMLHDINALGGSVAAVWRPDWTQISALTVKDRFSDTVFLLADTLKNADFDPAATEEARMQMLTEADLRDTDLFSTAYRGLTGSLFAGTSYARPEGGTAATINHLTRDDLHRYYAKYYIPANIVVVVVGNVDPQTALRMITDDLGDFPRTGRAAAGFADPLPPLKTDLAPVRLYQPGLDQQIVMAGYRAVPMADPDYPTFLVINALLGGMKSGRLFTELREKQGLTYDLGSVYDPRLGAGTLAAYVIGNPVKIDPATKKDVPTVGLMKTGLLAQIERLQTSPPTAAEIARAQHYLIGSYHLRHERLEDRATLLGAAELSAPDGYKHDTEYARYINAVTAADVQRVAAKYLVHPIISTVEPSKADGKSSTVSGG